mgnify:CR=1 FL=1
MSTQPTDAEIDAIVYEQTGFDGDGTQPMTADEMRRVTRAVLARWGQPAHSGEPVATVRTIHGVTVGYLETAVPAGAKLYTAPQPVEREPLTRERVKAICAESGYETATLQERADFINGIRHAERHHGIKGGQHGAE